MSRIKDASGLLIIGLVFGIVAYIVSSFSLSQSSAQGVGELIAILALLGAGIVLFGRRRK